MSATSQEQRSKASSCRGNSCPRATKLQFITCCISMNHEGGDVLESIRLSFAQIHKGTINMAYMWGYSTLHTITYCTLNYHRSHRRCEYLRMVSASSPLRQGVIVHPSVEHNLLYRIYCSIPNANSSIVHVICTSFSANSLFPPCLQHNALRRAMFAHPSAEPVSLFLATFFEAHSSSS